MSDNLINCPFCGGEALYSGGDQGHKVACKGCGMGVWRSKEGYDSDKFCGQDVVKIWNTRCHVTQHKHSVQTLCMGCGKLLPSPGTSCCTKIMQSSEPVYIRGSGISSITNNGLISAFYGQDEIKPGEIREYRANTTEDK